MTRRKELSLDGNGGRFAAFSTAESTVADLTQTTPGVIDIDDLWGDIPGDPAAAVEPAPAPTVEPVPEVAPEPEPIPEPIPEVFVAPELPEAPADELPDFPDVGEGSGLFTHPSTHRTFVSGDEHHNEILVTPWNRDLLADLTQDDVNRHTGALMDALATEEERLAARVTTADITLGENPTAEDLQRVATAIDEAFTQRQSLLGRPLSDAPTRQVLADVYGTEDRAIVALGTAVANRADELAKGYAEGGAENTETWWLQRCEELEAAETARYEHRVASGMDYNGFFVKSSDLQDLEAARDPKTARALEDMVEAYTAALSEVRDMSGELALHARSSKPAAKIVEATSHIWPADWVDASNGHTAPLHIGASVRRGHYVHHTLTKLAAGKGQGTKALLARENSAGEMVLTPEMNWGKSPKNAPGRSVMFYAPMSDEEKRERFPTKSQWEIANAVVGTEWLIETEENFEKYEEWYRSRGYLAKADGLRKGYELATDPDWNNGEPFYRKPQIREIKEARSEVVSQIKLSPAGRGLPARDPRYPVAVHEVGHRMEYLAPNLSKMTHTWRSRRVAESPNEDGRKLTTIYRGTSEKAYRDEFNEHYVGKVYNDRVVGQTAEGFEGATEVFSMGSDSVFGGRQGGLIGLSRSHKPDPDMRAFILGCFASAGMAKGSG